MKLFKHFMVILLAAASLSACADDKPPLTAENGGEGVTDNGSIIDPMSDTPITSAADLKSAFGSTDQQGNALDRVFFALDSSTLSDEAQQTLQKQASLLKRVSGFEFTLTVEGHCDERGTREYNLALGERRAAAVKNYLASLGVDGHRITTISYGKEHPEILGSNEAAWSKNRRAVSVVN